METAPASPATDPTRPVERSAPASTNALAALPATATTPHDPVASPVKPAVSATADPPEGDTGPETALLADMQAALREADSKRVLSLVAEHERLFPRSSFAPEREGARTLALCVGADHFNAARIGQAFLDAHPLSPLAGRVRGTCQLDSTGR
jgi:hypothetical protein